MPGYSSRFRKRKPPCYGKGYDDKLRECRKECQFREGCYDRMEWDEDEEDEDEPVRRREKKRKKRKTRTSLARPSDDLLDELLYLEDGEPWHHRLGWDVLAKSLSAAGGQFEEFFDVFRFQPKARTMPNREEEWEEEEEEEWEEEDEDDEDDDE